MNWYIFFIVIGWLLNNANLLYLGRRIDKVRREVDDVSFDLENVSRQIDSFRPQSFTVRFHSASRWDVSRKLVFNTPEEAKAFFDCIVKIKDVPPVKEPPSEFS